MDRIRYGTEYVFIQGLPGSGKSTFAINLLKENENTAYVNIDEKDYQVITNCTGGTSYVKTIIVDGLYANKEELIEKAKKFNEWVKKFTVSSERHLIDINYKKSHCLLYYFVPDVEACIQNDKNRGRENLATLTIRKYAKKMTPIIDKKIELKTKVYEYIKVPDNKEFLMSDWMKAENASEGFVEFDEWLEKNYPNITFLKYKKIQKLVEKETSYLYDYYQTDGEEVVKFFVDLKKVVKEIGEL